MLTGIVDPHARRHAGGGPADPRRSGPRVVVVKGGHLPIGDLVDRRGLHAGRGVRACADRASTPGTRTAPDARSRRRSPRTWRSGSRSTRRCAGRARISKAPSAMRRVSEPGTGRSTISGGYTDQMTGRLPSDGGLRGDGRGAGSGGGGGGGRAQRRRRRRRRSSGLVRDHNAGRQVLWLDYEAFAPLALKAFEQIAAEAAGTLAGRAAGDPSPHRTRRDRRSERRDRGGLAAPRRRLRRVPLRDRARQADRADLEARALRGRRGLDRRRDGRSGGRRRRGWRRWSGACT